MGGSRCTYRNCTVRSDGVVHMFHYPVYDKIRCHQWIVNAHRLDFLNLKLSQVRNRVVCQHHFKEDNFMNYLKDKLTFDAVPTEDGPYCVTSQDKLLPVDHIAKAYSAAINDVDDNEKYSKINSKAHRSMIYADFLTNGDAWEKRSLNETIWNNMVTTAKNRTDNDKITIVWNDADDIQVKEISQKSIITLTDLVEDVSNTKITEFENPLLANVNFNDNKEDINENIGFKSYTNNKSNQKSNNDNSKQELGNILANQESEHNLIFRDSNIDALGMKKVKTTTKRNVSSVHANSEPTNVVVNQEQNSILPNPNLESLLVSQDNNMIVNFDNFVGSNNFTVEKTVDIEIPALQDIHTIGNQNNISQMGQVVTTTTDYCAIIQNPSELAMQVESINNDVKPEEQLNNCITIDEWKAKQVQNNLNKLNVTKKPKVTILSEKTISDPVHVKGQLEPVSPSAYIHVSRKTPIKPVVNLEIKQESTDTKPELLKTNESIKDVIKLTDNRLIPKIRNKNKSNEVLLKPSAMKHKMAPERAAAIEKKRNFNKRLIDIIEICLDKLDDQDKISEEVKVNTPKVRDAKAKENSLKENMGTYLSKQAELPNPQEYMMKYLDNRMKKMEDTLLSKIEQNSQRIVELKHSISQSPQVSKAISTQTPHDEESYKKQLYNEMSQFLSPSANSLVYEELFINKYSQKLTNQPSPSKRRRRR